MSSAERQIGVAKRQGLAVPTLPHREALAGASDASAAQMPSISLPTRSSASRICITVAVSVMSCVVAPQCDHSPSLSLHNLTSCCTTGSTG